MLACGIFNSWIHSNQVAIFPSSAFDRKSMSNIHSFSFSNFSLSEFFFRKLALYNFDSSRTQLEVGKVDRPWNFSEMISLEGSFSAISLLCLLIRFCKHCSFEFSTRIHIELKFSKVWTQKKLSKFGYILQFWLK